MKILICTSTFTSITHGPSKFVNLVLNSSTFKENTDLRILTEDISEEIPNKIYKYSQTYPRIIGAFWEYGDNYIFYRKIKDISKDFQPDVIVFINTTLSYLSVKRLSKKFRFIGFINDDEALLNGTQHKFLSKLWFHKKKARFLEKRGSRNLDHVVANSKHISNLIQKEYQIPTDKVSVLYKGVDTSYFHFVEKKDIELAKPINILFIKSDYERGGLIILGEALSMLNMYKFRLLVCGLMNTDKARSELTQSPHVELEFVGAQTQEDVRSLMHQSDILCVPALREGLGVVNIEGLATGIPVVSTSAGGIVEVLGDGEFGWLARPDDAIDLARVLDLCMNSPEERLKKSLLGRAFVEERFDKEKMVAAFYEILESVLL